MSKLICDGKVIFRPDNILKGHLDLESGRIIYEDTEGNMWMNEEDYLNYLKQEKRDEKLESLGI